MSRKFNVGDRVRLIGARYPQRHPEILIGTETTIIGEPVVRPGSVYAGRWYPIDIPVADGRPWHAAECDLAPIYDGHEKTSWSECAWRPKSITVC